MTNSTESTEMSFEDALKELEAIVSQFEKGEVSLDDAVAAYERGSKLKTQCQNRLDEARMKVEQIKAQRGASEAEGVGKFNLDDTSRDD